MAVTTFRTSQLRDGILSADAAGRAKMASGFFDAATFSDKVAAAAVADDRLTTSYIKADGTRAFTGNQSLGGFKLTSLGTPAAAGDATTKAYVDSIAQGLDPKESVRLATAAALPACTAAGSGVGKTLTADANGALSVDGVAVAASDRILVKDQATGANNGIYVVTATGGAGAPFILTRATDFDESAEVDAGAFTFVEEGTANGDTGWLLSTNNPITVDTTALSFTQFSSAGVIEAGAGLTKSGNTLNVVSGNGGIVVNADDITLTLASSSGLEILAGGLQVDIKDTSLAKDASGLYVNLNGTASGLEVSSGLRIDVEDTSLVLSASGVKVQLDSAGAISLDGGGAGLQVNVDGSTIEIATNALQLKDAGVTWAKLASAIAARLGRYDRHDRFTGGTSVNLDLAVADADLGTDGTATGGHLVYLNGQLLSSGAGNDYTTSDNGGAGGVDRIVLATAPSASDVIDVLYKRTGNAI